MKQIRKQNILEQSIYWIIWTVIFLAPLIGGFMIIKGTENQSIEWRMVGRSWLKILPFFIIFLANNYVLMPSLFFRKRYRDYIIYVFLLIIGLCMYNLFTPYLYKVRFPDRELPRPFVQMQDKVDQPSGNDIMRRGGKARKQDFYLGRPGMDEEENRMPFFDKGKDSTKLSRQPDMPPMMTPWFRRRPVPVFDQIFLILTWLITTILMIGFNIAIKLLFQSVRDEEKMKELEKERLSSELQYLKYQINPHFFMNTLNNIHALVDIDTDKAKSSIIELSKLMRYVLYEANNSTISLSREVQFLNNYVTLMRLRFTDKVRIEIDIPSTFPEIQIPPLLFISFLENAFKHGISYRKESYIKMKLQIDSKNKKLIFYCVNTVWRESDECHHGIGLKNITKRLQLLYGDDYTLSIDDDKEKNMYEILLVIPL